MASLDVDEYKPFKALFTIFPIGEARCCNIECLKIGMSILTRGKLPSYIMS